MIFLRYLVTQLLAYGADMGVFLLILHFGWAGPIVANVISKLAAGCFAFVVHRSFTFGVAGDGFVGKQAIRYFILLAANVPIASMILATFLLWMSQPVAAKLLSDVVMVAVSYALSKHFIFKTKPDLLNSSAAGE
ncbi:GtrA family protein [Mariprofundus ferrooxydans]|uniref:GtrA family protein n=1 Tax=Mariprofundus ferrooxydans TaxID=314344 RepID=UPI00037C1B4B|nr:GtrA family protein [Mariprofundus ferrooxydans]